MTNEVSAIMASSAYRAAVDTLDREHDRTVDDIVTLTEIPSPPFGEDAARRAYLEMLRAHGLDEVEIDGDRQRHGPAPRHRQRAAVVVAAHLDTVFPAGTDVKVRREGTKLFAPGVGDDTRSLAVLLAYHPRAGRRQHPHQRATSCSSAMWARKGLGDLRGMRHLFARATTRTASRPSSPWTARTWSRIAIGGVGSKRYRVTFRGPGGHSFGAFGLVNPMFAMATPSPARRASRCRPSPRPPSAPASPAAAPVNSIPNEVWMEVDLRSEIADGARPAGRPLPGDRRAGRCAAENAARSTAQRAGHGRGRS